MLRVVVILAVSLFACSKDQPAPVAPAGKAASIQAIPSAPSNLRVEALTDTSALVAWDAVESATDYDLNYKKIGGKWKNWPHKGAAKQHSSLYGLEPDTEYRWAVRAENTDGPSRWVFGDNFTTLDPDSGDDLISDSIELEIEPEVVGDPFNIDLVFTESFRQHFSTEGLNQIRYAASRWEEVLTDIPDWDFLPIKSSCYSEPVRIPSNVDDLILFFGVLPPGRVSPYGQPVLGTAIGGTSRNDFDQGDPNAPFSFPVSGCIEITPEEQFNGDGDHLAAVAAHEIGHALGFGPTLYQYPPNGLRDILTRVEVGATWRDHKTFWIGPQALSVYHQAGGKGDIPMDIGHWKRTSLMANTLMNPSGNRHKPFQISTLDLAAIADLGYPVRMDQATPLELRRSSGKAIAHPSQWCGVCQIGDRQ